MDVNELSRNLQRFVWQPNNIVIPNYYYNRYEFDLFRLLPSGYIYEYEIKISRSDFFNDFNKIDYRRKYIDGVQKKHELLLQGKHSNRFYFVCPEGLLDVSDIPDYCGLIINGNRIIKPAKLLHKNTVPEKIFKQIAIKLSFRNEQLRKKLYRRKIK